MEKTDVNKKIEEVIFKTFSNSSFLNAYLIETNNNNQNFIVEQITKLLFDNKINNDDIFIMDYENEIIKKENIFELKKHFSTKSIHGSRRIYIIKNSENMNLSFANSLLKFLEEPEENIHGILLANKIVTIPSTIISRCQVIRMPKLNRILEPDNIIDEFISELKEKKYRLISNRIKYTSYFKEKSCHDVLTYILEKNKESLVEQKEISIIKMVKEILKLLDESKLSYNEELFFDRIVISLSRCISENWLYFL